MDTPAESYISESRPTGIGPYFTGGHQWLAYLLAIALAIGMALARLAASTLLGNEAPLLPFVLVVAAATYLGGRGPGVLAVAASAAAAHLLFAHISGPGYQALAWLGHLTLFLIVGGLIAQGIHRLQKGAAALQDSESRLRNILDRASAVVFLKDRDGCYLFVNDEFLKIFDLKREHVIGRTEMEIFPQVISTEMREHDLRVWISGLPLTVEEIVPRKEGLHTYVATKFLLFDTAGAPYALCGIATNITDQKNIEEALRQADQRKDIFLATLSHELRNPLAPIRHAAHLLRAPQLAARDAERAREIIERQSQHLSRLLDDLLDVSRITRGRLELRKDLLTVSSVVETALEAVRPRLEARNHTMVVDVPTEPLYVYADGVRLSQVIANLLTNSAKYTPPGGKIQLHARREESEIVLRVVDNGNGIGADMLPRIFEMFSQGKSEREHAEGGLGIGLALVRGLLELHGGTVEARSDGPGRGSEFIVRVPAGEAPLITEDPVVALVPGTAPDAVKILIADDNKDAADSLEILLSSDGHNVCKAYDGTAAFAAAQTFRPDFALLDIGMPGLTGYEVAERIRAEDWGRGITLIALTGWGQAQDRERALAAGFNHHVTKPVEPERLQALLAIDHHKVSRL